MHLSEASHVFLQLEHTMAYMNLFFKRRALVVTEDIWNICSQQLQFKVTYYLLTCHCQQCRKSPGVKHTVLLVIKRSLNVMTDMMQILLRLRGP